jgi:AcrR family transcriptional regulator
MNAKTERYHHGDLKNALIEAAIDILAEEGVHDLSLRKVAARAGVSHAAPYAHFVDKQALIAAVSTEGYHRLDRRIRTARNTHTDDPLRMFIEAGWAYVRFAQEDPAYFKITLSGVVEKEEEYPSLVEATANAYQMFREIITKCKQAGILRDDPTDLLATGIWGSIHGLVMLVLDGQISHLVLDQFSLRRILVFSLSQYIQQKVPVELYDIPSTGKAKIG